MIRDYKTKKKKRKKKHSLMCLRFDVTNSAKSLSVVISRLNRDFLSVSDPLASVLHHSDGSRVELLGKKQVLPDRTHRDVGERHHGDGALSRDVVVLLLAGVRRPLLRQSGALPEQRRTSDAFPRISGSHRAGGV